MKEVEWHLNSHAKVRAGCVESGDGPAPGAGNPGTS